MVLNEFADRLADEGRTVSVHQIAYAAATGKLGEVPLDGARNRQFNDEHLERMIRWLDTNPRPGRKPKVRSNV